MGLPCVEGNHVFGMEGCVLFEGMIRFQLDG